MINEYEIRQIAADFWRVAGNPGGFPRNIEASILWTIPVAVVKLPRLRVAFVRGWLSGHGLPAIVPAVDRELRACVVATRGRGVIFIDGSDPVEEQRLSLAHELAHFLLDYTLPRDSAIAACGESIVAILDGDRSPTDAERLTAVLQGVTVGVYSRLWLRGPLGLVRDSRVVAHEDLADILAIELIAPRREILARARKLIDRSDDSAVAGLLQSVFGLPKSSADAYSRVLCATAKPVQTIKAWLGIE
ncbi:MAG TPA: ImmA/IrrE family metallo-endopeptidase [Tepidisphaeraceae bacterium]|nr:ImmA/IrrE family metallo-endopeptidase [Tepidisphaeraceae bacterium]